VKLDTKLMGWGIMQACPLYLSELAPAHLRGSFNICFQLATAVGILAANCLNYGKSATDILTEFYLLHSRSCMPVLHAALPRHPWSLGMTPRLHASPLKSGVMFFVIGDSHSFEMGHPCT
jgi:hypothetical protein